MKWRGEAAALVIVAVWSAVLIFALHGWPAPDLAAVFAAAHFVAEGRTDLLYAVDMRAFPEIAHPEWIAYRDGLGCDQPCLYPYVYPPIWAVLFAPVTRLADLQSLTDAALFVQIPAIGCSAFLAWRLWRPELPPGLWCLTLLILLPSTSIGAVGILTGQPQLLVTFLVLLAFERHMAGSPMVAGSALALAASIKLYPALFALYWLRGGEVRPVLAMIATGSLLLIGDLAVGGIEANIAFLKQLSLFSSGVIVVNWNHNLVAQYFWLTQILKSPETSGDVSFAVLPGLRALQLGLLCTGLMLLAVRWNRGDALWRRRTMLPALVSLVALVSPVAWPYYFVIPLLGLPLLLKLYGRPGLFLAIALGGIVLNGFPSLPIFEHKALVLPLAGALFGLGTFLAFALAPYRVEAASTS